MNIAYPILRAGQIAWAKIQNVIWGNISNVFDSKLTGENCDVDFMTEAKLANGAIDARTIAPGAITGDRFPAALLTNAKIVDNTLEESSFGAIAEVKIDETYTRVMLGVDNAATYMRFTGTPGADANITHTHNFNTFGVMFQLWAKEPGGDWYANALKLDETEASYTLEGASFVSMTVNNIVLYHITGWEYYLHCWKVFS